MRVHNGNKEMEEDQGEDDKKTSFMICRAPHLRPRDLQDCS